MVYLAVDEITADEESSSAIHGVVEYRSKSAERLSLLATFLAAMQAQLLFMIPADTIHSTTDEVISALFYTAIFLDVFSAVFSICSADHFDIISWWIDSIDQRTRASHRQSFSSARKVETWAISLERFSFFFLVVASASTIAGLETYVCAHQPRGVAYASTIVCVVAIGVVPVWTVLTYLRAERISKSTEMAIGQEVKMRASDVDCPKSLMEELSRGEKAEARPKEQV